MENTYIYEFENNLYLNLTNRCPNRCTFCIRNFKDGVSGSELWLSKEPTFGELKALLDARDLSKYGEVVFCGFGEPMCTYPLILQIGPYLKARGCVLRLNTNGLGNLINQCDDAAKRLAPFTDFVSISLNASNAPKYQKICRSDFGEIAFDAMLKFAKDCVEAGIDTTMSVVDCIGEKEIEACEKIVASTGAHFRVRATIKKETEY